MRTWISGLISALSGALAGALGVLVADPSTFNFDRGLRKLLIVCAFTGVVALLNYLKQSPIPGVKIKKLDLTGIAFILLLPVMGLTMQGCLTVGATGPEAAQRAGVPWYQDIQNWTPYQKANFFMNFWLAQKADYDAMNAYPNKSPELIALLEKKREIIERARVPVRSYSAMIYSGGSPNALTEKEITALLRELELLALK